MGDHEKPIWRGDCRKMGWLGQFVDLRGAWQERGGGVFEGEWGGGLTPQCTLWLYVN